MVALFGYHVNFCICVGYQINVQQYGNQGTFNDCNYIKGSRLRATATLSPSLKQNRDSHKCKEGRDVGTVVKRWLITQDTDIHPHRIEKPVARCDK